MTSPYRVTPVFDQFSLPAGLRREHRTKPGVWGVIRVLKGNVRLVNASGATVLGPDCPGLIKPEEPHWVEPLGVIEMQVEFYDSEPLVTQN
jgi:tellurite resistance-related uncharacterized protein